MPALVTAQSGDWGYIIEIETKIWRLNDLRTDGPTDEVNYGNSFPVKKNVDFNSLSNVFGSGAGGR